LFVVILAPSSSVGYTSKAQPTLYWYLSKPTPSPIRISVTPLDQDGKDLGADSVLDVTIPKTEPGLHALALANPPENHNPVTLKTGIQYRWVVEVLVNDLDDGSDNPTESIRLKRLPASDAVSAVESAAPEQQYDVYRQAGLWYDMLDSLNRRIDSNKDNPNLRQARRRLLSAQGLLEDADGTMQEKATE
jgi:hypothetical protein